MCEEALVVGVYVKVAVFVSFSLTASVVGVASVLRTVELLVGETLVKEAASLRARSSIKDAELSAPEVEVS